MKRGIERNRKHCPEESRTDYLTQASMFTPFLLIKHLEITLVRWCPLQLRIINPILVLQIKLSITNDSSFFFLFPSVSYFVSTIIIRYIYIICKHAHTRAHTCSQSLMHVILRRSKELVGGKLPERLSFATSQWFSLFLSSISSFSRSISEIFFGRSPYVFSKHSYALGNRMLRQWHAYLARFFQQTSHYNVEQAPRALWSRTRDPSPLYLQQMRVNRGFQSMKNLDLNFWYCGHVRFLRIFIHTAKNLRRIY